MGVLFAILFFFTPLILWPFTSEVFEFNKMIFVYLMTTAILLTWTVKSIKRKKIIFSRTILDIPVLVYLGASLLSTIFSIDPRTSFLGYYSRFNGGFLSVLCYSLLFWAFASNLDKKEAINSVKWLLISSVLVSLYAILEKLGIDKNVWVQDVQNRVFSTLGQPNWLASFFAVLIPLSFSFFFKEERKQKINILPVVFSSLLFLVIIFTKSRSGLLGFAGANVIFWGFLLVKQREKYLKWFLVQNIAFAVLAVFFGTSLTPSLLDLTIKNNQQKENQIVQDGTTVLEKGGTESGEIRKLVWKGAFETWKHYPIIGSGLETFAFTFPKFKPIEHNFVSEWDFIYNKAHNEYLNHLSTSGILGLLSYLALIFFSMVQIFKIGGKNEVWKFGIAGGYISLLVSNFFGFSVVVTQLLLFLLPAIAFAINTKGEEKGKDKSFQVLDANQKFALFAALAFSLYLSYLALSYWFADTLYLKAKLYNRQSQPEKAFDYVDRSIRISPKEPIFWIEKSESYSRLALKDKSQNNIAEALNASYRAISLSPQNPMLKKSLFSALIRFASFDPKYLTPAVQILEELKKDAPTDAKVVYNIGLSHARLGNNEKALEALKETVALKPNYKEARLAFALVLIELGNKTEAREQLSYILTKIDPQDSLTKQTLEEIK